MGKDYTKYFFDGRTYTKGRVVLAIVANYVKLHDQTTFNDLKKVFSDEIQSNTSIQFSDKQVVFEKTEKINKIEKKRFFMKETELVKLSDSTIAVSREWNKENILNLIHKAKQIGFDIQGTLA